MHFRARESRLGRVHFFCSWMSEDTLSQVEQRIAATIDRPTA
jgi:hypothetical protein